MVQPVVPSAVVMFGAAVALHASFAHAPLLGLDARDDICYDAQNQ